MDKVYFLMYDTSEERYLPSGEVSYTPLPDRERVLTAEEVKEIGVGNNGRGGPRSLCFGVCLLDTVTFHNYSFERIVLFNSTIQGHHFGQMMYDKIQIQKKKSDAAFCFSFPFQPKDISYWIHPGRGRDIRRNVSHINELRQ
jgi:hypothetical protein